MNSTTAECPMLDDSLFDFQRYTNNTYLRTGGSQVNVSCSAFGHRVVGARSLTCNATSRLWEPALPTCEWTWEFTTHEKIVLGTAVACVAFVIIVSIIAIIACCCCRRKMEKRAYDDMTYGDNPAFAATPGHEGGAYPDTYFAYHDANKHDMNGAGGAMDRAWLGYIPRPKVAEGRYYQ